MTIAKILAAGVFVWGLGSMAKAEASDLKAAYTKALEKMQSENEMYRIEGQEKRTSKGEAFIAKMNGKRVWKTCVEKEQDIQFTKSGTPTLKNM